VFARRCLDLGSAFALDSADEWEERLRNVLHTDPNDLSHTLLLLYQHSGVLPYANSTLEYSMCQILLQHIVLIGKTQGAILQSPWLADCAGSSTGTTSMGSFRRLRQAGPGHFTVAPSCGSKQSCPSGSIHNGMCNFMLGRRRSTLSSSCRSNLNERLWN
jgi:hypothetical protein